MKDQKKRDRFVKNLNYAMQWIGLDNKEVSLIVDCKPETVMSWMIGGSVPSRKNQRILAKFFHIQPKHLFSNNLLFRTRLLIKYQR